MIKPLQSLRGIFALIIFLSHFQVDGHAIFSTGGNIGVAFFFILSGFVLTLAALRRVNAQQPKIGWGDFMHKRLRKLIPIHLLCFVAAVLFYRPSLWLASVDLLLLQSWVPDYGVVFSLNDVEWYLSSLLLAYALFPFIIRLLQHNARAFAAVAIMVIGAWVTALPAIDASTDMALYWLYVFPPARLMDFMLGMLMCLGISVLPPPTRLSGFSATILEAAPFALIFAGLYTLSTAPGGWGYSVWWWLPCCGIIAVAALMPASPGLITRLLKLRPLVWFGNISFEFYMIHHLVIEVLTKSAPTWHLELPWAVWLPLLLLLTSAAASLLHRLLRVK